MPGNAAGIALLEQALAADLQSESPERMPLQVRLALLNEVGHLHFREDHVAATLAMNAESIALLESAGRGQSMNMAVMLMNHAAILSRVGQFSTAITEQQHALALAAQVEPGGEAPLGMAAHLATSQLRMANYTEAARLATDESRRARAAGNERMAAFADLLNARALGKLGRREESALALARAEASFRGNAKGNERMLNEVALTRADQLLRDGDPAAARLLVDQVLVKIGYPAKAAPPGLASALYTGVRVALAQGDAATAEKWAAAAEAYEEKLAIDWRKSANYGQAALNRALALAALGRNAEALRFTERAESALSAGFSPDHPDTVKARALREQLKTSSPG